MTRIAPYLTALTLALPAAAQEAPAPEARNEDVTRGLNMLQEGTRLLLDHLMEELGPKLEALQDQIIDLNAYEAPEILPNGDIIIRRKTPLPPKDEGESGPVDL